MGKVKGPPCPQCGEPCDVDKGFAGNQEEPPEPAGIFCDNIDCPLDGHEIEVDYEEPEREWDDDD